MYVKSQQLIDLLTARTKRKMSIRERQDTVLYRMMSAIDEHFSTVTGTDGSSKYSCLATLLSSPIDGGPSYAEIYKLFKRGVPGYTSDDVSASVNDAKRGENEKFIRAIINCIWENTPEFPFLSGKLTDPEEFDDDGGAPVWAALAYADLYTRLVQGADIPPATQKTGRVDGLVRIEDDLQIAHQRIAYSLDTGSGHVSFADLQIDFLPDELDQVDFMNSLDLRNTKIRSIPNLAKFKNLKILNCSYMSIANVKFLDGCDNLEVLYIGKSDVDSLDGIGGAPNLNNFYCGSTFVKDLVPLRQCPLLEHVSCENTYIESLVGLENSFNLHTVDCGTTQITSLKPLEGAGKLKRLVVSGCNIDHDSTAIWAKRSLKEVTFFGGSLGTVPPEILSKSARDNCQHRLLEYFKLNDDMVDFQSSKVFILGNGGVGKTQLAGLLSNREFATDTLSTHGVDVHSLALPPKRKTASSEAQTLQVWDFGGQELYHGIHAIFLRQRVIYILAWSPRHESGRYDDMHGGIFANHPASYWQAFIRSGGSSRSPLIVVETKIDELPGTGENVIRPVIQGFEWVKELRVSAREDRERHRDALLEQDPI